MAQFGGKLEIRNLLAQIESGFLVPKGIIGKILFSIFRPIDTQSDQSDDHNHIHMHNKLSEKNGNAPDRIGDFFLTIKFIPILRHCIRDHLQHTNTFL